LAQNWDWAQEFENLAVIVSRKRPDGHKTLQLTEPGVIGKIGFNDSGVGACLNFLTGRNNRIGVPVHLILRAVLDSASIDEALDRIQKAKSSSFSNILVGDRSGAYVDIELCERNKMTVTYPDKIPFHTNHFLGGRSEKRSHADDPVEEELYVNSIARLQRVQTLLDQLKRQSVDAVKQILGDRADGKHSICSEYKSIMGARI
jgi:isopenicillin-N N-acyltransferase-like protein